MLKGLSHPALRVEDIGRALDFYCGALGMREAFRNLGEDGKPRLIYLTLAPGQFVELFSGGVPHAPEEAMAVGMKHMAYEVDNLSAERERLLARGIEVSDIRTGLSGVLLCFLKDPDGNAIELMEYVPGSEHARWRDALLAEQAQKP